MRICGSTAESAAPLAKAFNRAHTGGELRLRTETTADGRDTAGPWRNSRLGQDALRGGMSMRVTRQNGSTCPMKPSTRDPTSTYSRTPDSKRFAAAHKSCQK